MSKVLIECSQRMPKELWETTLKKGLGPLYEDLNIRWEMLKPTGAYQEAHYRNITEFVGSPEEMKDKIGDAEILIVGVAPVSDDVMDADPNLRIVFCPRGGPVNVDVEGATQRGIMVVNAPGRNAEGVADQTIGLLICEARHLARAHCAVVSGTYEREFKAWRQFVPELAEKTLGLVGFGNVARKVAKRAKGFDMNILVYDPYISEDDVAEHGVRKVSMEELLKNSDFVSVHVRLTEGTWHLIGEKEFLMMKKNAIFVNTSRGHVVDEKALVQALREGRIAGAALDVVEEEPIQHHAENPLLKMNNVTITPHTAGVSDRVRERGVMIAAGDLARYLRGERIQNLLNREELGARVPA